MDGRALRPYPPIIVSIDGDQKPAAIVNLDPIEVVWKKRDRRKTTITLASDPDEPVETGTEYVVRHGPVGLETETVLGDDTETSGTFVLNFQGFNRISIFARRDGYESTSYTFDTVAANGDGVSAVGSVGTITMTAPAGAGTVVYVPQPLDAIDMVPPTGDADVGDVDVTGAIGTVTMTTPSGTAGVQGDAAGAVGTVTMTAPAGGVTGAAAASGTIGTVAMTTPAGAGAGSAAATGAVGTVTMSAPNATAIGTTPDNYSIIGSQFANDQSSASTTVYYALASFGTFSASSANEVRVQQPMLAGTFDKFRIYVSANARTTNTVFRLRINGANGNSVITVGSGATGWFEDSSNTDVISDGDKISVSVVTSTGTQTLTWRTCFARFKPSSGGSVIAMLRRETQFNTIQYSDNNVTHYSAPLGGFAGGFGSTRSESQGNAMRTLLGGTLSRLFVLVSANTRSTDTVVSTNIGGSVGNCTVTIPAATTGYFEDTTHSDTFSAGDELSYSAIGVSTGTIDFRLMGVMVKHADAKFAIYNIATATNFTTATDQYVSPLQRVSASASEVYSTTEALQQIKMPFPAILSKLSIYVGNNNSTANFASYLRVNGSDSAVTITTVASTSGRVDDTTHTATTVLDDLISVKYGARNNNTTPYYFNFVIEGT